MKAKSQAARAPAVSAAQRRSRRLADGKKGGSIAGSRAKGVEYTTRSSSKVTKPRSKRGATTSPTGKLSYSPVDAWNPEPEDRTRRPSVELVAVTPSKRKEKIAAYLNLRVPLHNRRAARAAVKTRELIQIMPLDSTRGGRALAKGRGDRIVYCCYDHADFEALLVPQEGAEPPSPWILPGAPWPAEGWHFDEERWRPKLRPQGNKYEKTVLRYPARASRVPWLQPTVTYEFQRARFGDEEQPIAEHAKDQDGLPVSPTHMPTVEEMSTEEFDVFVDTSKLATPAARRSDRLRNRSLEATRSYAFPAKTVPPTPRFQDMDTPKFMAFMDTSAFIVPAGAAASRRPRRGWSAGRSRSLVESQSRTFPA